jgi:hypothetical protein
MKVTCLNELLLHKDKVSKSKSDLLESYRLDITKDSNLWAWVLLRETLVEDANVMCELDYMLQQLNRAIIVCCFVIVWLIFNYFYLDQLAKNGPNTTTFLLLGYVFNIFVPTIFSLNRIVATDKALMLGGIEKLGLLKI